MATAFTEAASTLSNQAATIFTAKQRNGLVVANPSDTVMTVRFGATASATAGIPIAPGTAIEFRSPRSTPDGLVSLFCAGASKAYTAYEW